MCVCRGLLADVLREIIEMNDVFLDRVRTDPNFKSVDFEVARARVNAPLLDWIASMPR